MERGGGRSARRSHDNRAIKPLVIVIVHLGRLLLVGRRGRRPWQEAVERGRRALGVAGKDVGRLALEGWTAGEQGEGERAERIDIAARFARLTAHTLRRQIG